MHQFRFCCALLLIASASPALSAESAADLRKQALVCSQKKQWDQALALYRNVLATRPQDPDTHYDLALVLKYKGDPAAAIKEFTKALQMKPDWSAGITGSVQHITTWAIRPQESQNSGGRYSSIPTTLLPGAISAGVLLGDNNPGEAIGQLEAVCKLRPQDAGARAQLGLAYLENGNPENGDFPLQAIS